MTNPIKLNETDDYNQLSEDARIKTVIYLEKTVGGSPLIRETLDCF